MVNTVKLCSSETSQAALVIADIQKLYAFVEKVQVGMLKEVEDRLLVALLHKSKFTGWREVLVSMANQGLFNHHADLQTAVLLCESAANASPEDLEKAVKQAQSLEASKSLSKIVKAGPWATHIFEKMHACGATQKLQQAHSGSYTICGAGFAELITTTFAAHAFLILVGLADQEPDVERSTEFVEFQRATETVGANLKTQIEALLGEIWDGVFSETLGLDQAWKSYKGVQTLVGSISIASKLKQEELEDTCDKAWSALSVRGLECRSAAARYKQVSCLHAVCQERTGSFRPGLQK